jgi:SAM-dependent methyltransferase
MNDQPSAWVSRFAPLVPPGGTVLDLACGGGRHTRLFAAMGHPVHAVDRDADSLAQLAQMANVTIRCADIEGGPWPYAGSKFAAIVVTNYLWRPLWPLLLAALEPDGVLIYETFMFGHERLGRPNNPAFLLRPGELLEVVHKHLTVVAFEQGEVTLPRPAVVQRLCALRGPLRNLP